MLSSRQILIQTASHIEQNIMSEANTSAKAAGSADAGTSAASTTTSSSNFQPWSKNRIVKDD